MSKIYYLCPDFDQSSGRTRELYWHVWQLRQQGLDAWIVYHKEGSRLRWHGIDVPMMSLADSPNLTSADVIVLPEVMGPILNHLPTAAVDVNKVMLVMNWHPHYWKSTPSDNWTHYDIQAVLTSSTVIADYVNWQMNSWQMNLPVTVIPSYVDPRQYFYDASLKRPIIAYVPSEFSDAAILQDIFEARSDYAGSFHWQAITATNEADYVQQLRQASVYLASSFQEGLNSSVLEAMASGCLVVGYHGIGGREFMVGEDDRQSHQNYQNCILVENGNLPALGLALEKVLLNWHNASLSSNTTSYNTTSYNYNIVVQNAIATAQCYQNKNQQAEALATFYQSLLDTKFSPTSLHDLANLQGSDSLVETLTVNKFIADEDAIKNENMAYKIISEGAEIAKGKEDFVEQKLKFKAVETVTAFTSIMESEQENYKLIAERDDVKYQAQMILINSEIGPKSDALLMLPSSIEKTEIDDNEKNEVKKTETEEIRLEKIEIEAASSDERLNTPLTLVSQTKLTQTVSLSPSETKQKSSRPPSSRSGQGFGKVMSPRKGKKGKKVTEKTIPTLVQKAAQLRRDGQLEDAQILYKQAFDIDNTVPELWFNYGNLLQQIGQLVDAEKAFRRSLTLRPEFFPAHLNLANLLRDRHQIEDAITHYRHAIKFNSRFFLAYHHLGKLLTNQHRATEATEVFISWAQADPKNPVPLNGLGIILQSQGHYSESILLFKRALTLAPERSDSLNYLGALLQLLHRSHEALPYLRQAIAHTPTSDTTLINFIHALLGLGQVGEALTQTQQVLEQSHNSASGHLVRGCVLNQLAQHTTAMAHFQHTWDLEHRAVIAVSNALFTLLHRDDLSDANLVAERQRWVKKLPQPTKQYDEWQGDRNPDRQLKVGYLSTNLRSHPISFFLEPILAHHNHEQIEVYCYDTGGIEDEVTRWLKGDSDHWCVCSEWTDEAVAQRIHNDGIDILVDLSGHTASTSVNPSNRSGVIMHKPAPIQMLYIGYPGSTGLTQMDYIIADDFVIPSSCESFYTEKIIRVGTNFWCFQPHPAAPEPNPLPALDNGYITFGSFNTTIKLSPSTICLWSQVLNAIPTARLKLKALSLGNEQVCDHFRQQFKQHGINVDRIVFEGSTMPIEQFFQSYHTIDIALDPTPYNGGTTTCESMWMGVPVITVRGQRFCSRMGHSLLHSVGLGNLSAETEADYVNIAIALAADLGRLQTIRQTLRNTMKASPLCDGALATQNLEDAYRQAWLQFCQSPQ